MIIKIKLFLVSLKPLIPGGFSDGKTLSAPPGAPGGVRQPTSTGTVAILGIL